MLAAKMVTQAPVFAQKERGAKREKKRGRRGGFLRKSSHLFAFVRAEVARACVCAKKVVTLQADLWTWVYGCPRTGKIQCIQSSTGRRGIKVQK